MDGLECTEILKSELEYSDRLDSEYYKKEYLEYEKIVNTQVSKKMSEIADFLIGPFGSAYDTSNYVEESNYRYVRGQDVKPFVLKDTDPRYMAKEDYDRLSKYALKPKDILVSVVGTLGNACLVREKDVPAIFSCKSTVIRAKKMNPYYLIAYLNSNHGKNLLLRQERGAIQKGLNLDDIKTLDVPQFSYAFQALIEKLITASDEALDLTKRMYQDAEDSLLTEIGMKDFEENRDKVAVKSFSVSFGVSGRLDAEYYQKKYDDLFKILLKNNNKKLKDIVSITKSVEPGSDFYREEGIPFVRVSNLFKYEITEPDIYLNESDFAKGSLPKPKKDTILLSKDGSVGIAYKVIKDENFVTSGAILHLTVKNSVLPDYLTLVLNSKITLLQAERDAGGSIIQHWKPSEIEQVVIPIVSIELQQKLADKVQESFSLREQSKELLEKAKRAVEIAIEQGEEEAMNYLNEF